MYGHLFQSPYPQVGLEITIFCILALSGATLWITTKDVNLTKVQDKLLFLDAAFCILALLAATLGRLTVSKVQD